MKSFFTVFAVFFALLCGAEEETRREKPRPVDMEEVVEENTDLEMNRRFRDNPDWDFIGLVFFPGAPAKSMHVDVYGIKIGFPVSAGEAKVCGLETGLFACLTDRVYGLQASPFFNNSYYIDGMQASLVNSTQDSRGLFQFGLVNVSRRYSVQFGLVNYLEDALIPFFPIINFSF